jgi:hypothetical protein
MLTKESGILAESSLMSRINRGGSGSGNILPSISWIVAIDWEIVCDAVVCDELWGLNGIEVTEYVSEHRFSKLVIGDGCEEGVCGGVNN